MPEIVKQEGTRKSFKKRFLITLFFTYLLIFLLGRITKGKPPIIPEESKFFLDAYADPVPQALILTAIVISFGLQSFAIVLIKRAYKVVKTDDLDQMNSTDEFS
ncbi:NADH-quinone oxidoreductase subunit K [uncultured Planktosalinus sp.]|uniref:NADH-quinone oxidoreductase subunit K n=1 Tax=uncultured Planktosalinus sp. TaxID=1810935 RepID=UPI0030DB9886